MHRGFNLNIDNSFFSSDDYERGKKSYGKIKKDVKYNLRKYMYEDSSLDGNKIADEWFPNIKADVFISHSHTDERLAIKLAGWLEENFNLKCFIDSCVWGYADDLLFNIDNDFCFDPEKGTYRYEDRNYSTSHVHMMLSTALNSMIDNVECIIFLNTENSIQTVENVINKTTRSPWIYSELETTKIIRKRPISDYRVVYETKSLNEDFNKYANTLTIRYRCDLNHLCDLDSTALKYWKLIHGLTMYNHGLDNLYSIIESKNGDE
ncbi:Uncharacterised protein [uncultured Clostridium sp.]|nr:Uncharacterised protein [uncultured Clostridium sp.]SCJ49691.1 Uncharacterised protein [uncultured Clostridium sp.]